MSAPRTFQFHSIAWLPSRTTKRDGAPQVCAPSANLTSLSITSPTTEVTVYGGEKMSSFALQIFGKAAQANLYGLLTDNLTVFAVG